MSAAIEQRRRRAARVLRRPEKKLTMRLPIITPRVPPTSCGVRYSPRIGMKTKITAVTIPGLICGSRILSDRRARRRAEVHRRLELVPVEALERRVQRQRREREVEVDEDEDHRRPVVEEERDRLVVIPVQLEEAVDRALRAEDVDPRVDAEQVARPERQDHEQEQQPWQSPRHVPDEPVRERERHGDA